MHFWGDMFSQQYGLEWEAEHPGDALALPFFIAKQGRYRVVARPCGTEAGGMFMIALDDLKPTKPINLYRPPPFPDPVDVEVAEVELSSGNHKLMFISQVPDDKAKGQRLLLDNFRVTGVEPTESQPSPQEDTQP